MMPKQQENIFFVALIVIIAKIYIAEDVKIIIKSIVVLVSWVSLCTSASKSSIRKFVITKKAPTRAFSWLKPPISVG